MGPGRWPVFSIYVSLVATSAFLRALSPLPPSLIFHFFLY